MQSHFDLSDDEFEQQFADCSFNPSLFSHEAHLRLAYIHIKKYGVDQSVINFCKQLKVFTQHIGAESKFNTTLTVAAVRAVYHFTLKSNSHNFNDFINEFPRLMFNFKELMEQHYTRDIYHSIEAKKKFLEPDLLPFD